MITVAKFAEKNGEKVIRINQNRSDTQRPKFCCVREVVLTLGGRSGSAEHRVRAAIVRRAQRNTVDL